MKLNAYLTFNGECENAMNFYADVLNGELTMMSRFSEMPPSVAEIPESAKNLVMHSTLNLGNFDLMASDTIEPERLNTGNHCSLSVNVDAADEAADVFNSLAEGGIVTMPFEDAFWGGKFGMLTDKFGIQWMVSSAHKPS